MAKICAKCGRKIRFWSNYGFKTKDGEPLCKECRQSAMREFNQEHIEDKRVKMSKETTSKWEIFPEQCQRCGKHVVYEIHADGDFCPECGWSREAAAAYAKKHKGCDQFAWGRFKELRLYDNVFSYRNREHPYTAVVSLGFFWQSTKVRINYIIPGGTNNTAWLEIHLAAKRGRIHISAGGALFTFTNPGTEVPCKALHDLYRDMAQRTFSTRAERYLAEINRHGFFTYDGARFHVNGDVEKGRRRLAIGQALLTQEAYSFGLKPRNESVVKSLFASDAIYVSTCFDKDVFFALLAQCYGIRTRN